MMRDGWTMFDVIDKVKELSHVALTDCFSPLTVVNQKALHFKVKWVLKENVIVNRQLKGRSQNTPNGMDGTIAFATLLEVNQVKLCI